MSGISINEARPPYVKFETRTQEDRQRTIETGKYVSKDVDIAIITPQGSKDRIEKEVNDWFLNLDQAVRDERLPASWLAGYKEAYARWKSDQEPIVNGTPLRDSGLCSPAQLQNCQTFNVRSVEDLANANEETVARLGMGARDLVQRAKTYLTNTGGWEKERAQLLERIAKLEAGAAAPVTGGSNVTLSGFKS